MAAGPVAESKLRLQGLLIEFKPGSKLSNQERDQLHHQTGHKLVYRSLHLNIDQVTPLSSASLGRIETLESACAAYERNAAVSRCEIQKKITPPDSLAILGVDVPDSCLNDPGFNESLQRLSKQIQFSAEVLARISSCSLADQSAPSRLKGLSPFWAQEYIGADLAGNAMKSIKGLRATKVANLDGGFERESLRTEVDPGIDWNSPNLKGAQNKDHGTPSSNLIGAPFPVGVGRKVILGPLVNIYPPVGSILAGADQVIERKPALVNLEIHTLSYLSKHFGGYDQDTELTKTVLRRMADTSIVVATAGNHYPHGSAGDRPARDLGLLLVGSMNPKGWISDFSDESEDVTVLAPADHYQTSIGLGGKFSPFGGTSGAAPLVTGALSNVLSVLPELNREEAKILLERTALSNAATTVPPNRNGAGMLNALKLVEVAKRLKQRGWPAQRAKLLQDPGLYDFTAEAGKLSALAKEKLRSGNCSMRRKGLEEARSAFLLNQDPLARSLLIETYDKEAFPVNAQFYRNFQREELVKDVESSSGVFAASSASSFGASRGVAMGTAGFGMGIPVDTSQSGAFSGNAFDGSSATETQGMGINTNVQQSNGSFGSNGSLVQQSRSSVQPVQGAARMRTLLGL